MRSGSQTYNETVLISFLLILLFVVLTIILGVVITCFNLKGFRYMLHIIWLLLMIISVFTFILTAILVPFVFISYEGCGVLSNILASSNGYQQYTQILNLPFFNQTETCLFGNGSMSDSFGFTEALSLLNNIDSSFSTIYEIQNNSLEVNDNPDTATMLLNNATEILDNYYLQPPDMACATNSSDCVTFMLIYADSWSDSSINKNQSKYCNLEISADTWVLANESCPLNYTNILTQNNPTQYFGLPTCVNPLDFSSITINRRYNQGSFFECSLVTPSFIIINTDISVNTVNGIITTYWNSIDQYQTALINNYTNLNTSINNYIDQLDILTTQLFNLTSNLSEFQDNIENLSDLVSNPSTGLIASSNCSFAGGYLKQIYSDYCISIMPSLITDFNKCILSCCKEF